MAIIETYPWLSIVLFAVAVEVLLIARGARTLSQRARDAARVHPWVPWVVIAVVALLCGHFWLGWFWN